MGVAKWGGVAVVEGGWREWEGGEVELGGGIDLWVVELPTLGFTRGAGFVEWAEGRLGEAEVAGGRRRRVEGARLEYLGGRVGLRGLICAYTGLGNGELRFGVGSRGKPFLRNGLAGGEFCFNYSLAGGYALYAVGWNRRLGVDLEVYPRGRGRGLAEGGRRLARGKLTGEERGVWEGLAEGGVADGERAMLACWTRKEAYGKALGVGMRYWLNRVGVFGRGQVGEPGWEVGVGGLFDGDEDVGGGVVYGLQVGLPRDLGEGVGALVYDGGVVGTGGVRFWRVSNIDMMFDDEIR